MLKRFVRDIGHYFKKLYFMDVWRKKNKHNFTIAGEVFNINKVVVGNGTYGKLNVQCYGNSKEKLVIGNYCSISDNVNFILGGNHPYDIVTTYPIYKKIINNKCEAASKGKIIIEDDVWIGYGSIILSGVTIGQGSIIAAGSVVTNNVEPYSIYGGVPAKLIKKRFDDETIEKLKEINYGKFDKAFFIKNVEIFNQKVNKNNISEIIKKLKK